MSNGLTDILELRSKGNQLFHQKKFEEAMKAFRKAGNIAREIEIDDLNANTEKLDKDGPIQEGDYNRLKAILFYNAAT